MISDILYMTYDMLRYQTLVMKHTIVTHIIIIIITIIMIIVCIVYIYIYIERERERDPVALAHLSL